MRAGAGAGIPNVFRNASSPRPSPPFKAMEERVPRTGDGGRYSEGSNNLNKYQHPSSRESSTFNNQTSKTKFANRRFPSSKVRLGATGSDWAGFLGPGSGRWGENPAPPKKNFYFDLP